MAVQLSKLSDLADKLAYEIRSGTKVGHESLTHAVNEITGGDATRKGQALNELALFTLVKWPNWEPTSLVTNTIGRDNFAQLAVLAERARQEHRRT